ncbi:hypothetical protein FI667_g8543, partial [Globisporangium splendens]
MPLETTFDKIDGSKIARWHLPSMLGGDDLLLPLSTKVEIRASCIDSVRVNGGPMQRFTDLVVAVAELAVGLNGCLPVSANRSIVVRNYGRAPSLTLLRNTSFKKCTMAARLWVVGPHETHRLNVEMPVKDVEWRVGAGFESLELGGDMEFVAPPRVHSGLFGSSFSRNTPWCCPTDRL